MEKVPSDLLDITVATWTVNDVSKWLELQGFGTDLRDLFSTHEIDGYTLLRISENDLRQPPVSLVKLGTIKHLIGAIADLKRTIIAKVDVSKPGMPVAEEDAEGRLGGGGGALGPTKTGTTDTVLAHQLGVSSDGGLDTSDSDTEETESPTASQASRGPSLKFPSQHRRLPPLKPEIGKAVLAFAYFLIVTVVTSFVMVIVHDRVPDMEKYPPLPDFVLDNVPLIPWAFDLCEVAGFLLAVVWTFVLLFHKYRFILLRRFFVLMGTIFLLRSVCMLITSMSVPGRHLKCAGKNFGDLPTKVQQALVIARGFGMSIQGVRTCGDYMFSGHTVVITVLNHFITEYTPKRHRLIHLSSWTLNLFGMFFILAAHEHYSIDVFIAFYISSRLFLYYHTMANTDILRRHPRRANLYFPLYAFFEAEVYRVVPNEYEWPFMLSWPYVKFFREEEQIVDNNGKPKGC
ncbi:sphingomyelin synthase-related protein 1-like [Paramacrobiotus metropolitanus]|uniref:sphingomyelin synthase-related protein 1-like n=1 Tax=Paramacrobiotus metropolitanus TaxID=2943436 RepID=UPI00244635D4|nr:sphingomyelin synthase-related protein 1-like [Paramacrobiotus metropolitanus]XP_055339667.1 sphingomyelin synthase-related protein 1-like [Paramacrobiotus metropolitanus]XP_055339669.1 sphingomyelin synthase-related protein 1-like [Paramacrobiotus metropolitanus]